MGDFYLFINFFPGKNRILHKKFMCIFVYYLHCIERLHVHNTRFFLGASFQPPLYYILLPVKYYWRTMPLAGYWGRALPKLMAALQHSSSWHCTAENIKCKGQAKQTVLEQKTTFPLKTAFCLHCDYVGKQATLCLFGKNT